MWFAGIFTFFILSTIVAADHLYKGFSWSDCSASDAPIKLQTLQVGPDPLIMPGMISVGFTGFSKLNITSPKPLKVTMHKKVGFFWVPVPCEHNLGTCDYPDFCTFWPIPKPCPKAYVDHHIPCSCPFPAGNYSFPYTSVIPFDLKFLPTWLENGDYRLKAIITNPQDEILYCMNLSFTMHAPQ